MIDGQMSSIIHFTANQNTFYIDKAVENPQKQIAFVNKFSKISFYVL